MFEHENDAGRTLLSDPHVCQVQSVNFEVHVSVCAEVWLRQGRQVREEEKPAKSVRKRGTKPPPSVNVPPAFEDDEVGAHCITCLSSRMACAAVDVGRWAQRHHFCLLFCSFASLRIILCRQALMVLKGAYSPAMWLVFVRGQQF